MQAKEMFNDSIARVMLNIVNTPLVRPYTLRSDKWGEMIMPKVWERLLILLQRQTTEPFHTPTSQAA